MENVIMPIKIHRRATVCISGSLSEKGFRRSGKGMKDVTGRVN